MTTFIHESDEEVRIPAWVVDPESFRRWADTDDFPETGRIWFLKGEVWVDMSREQLFSHLAVKNAFNIALGGLVKADELGLYLPDGLFLCNVHAEIAGNPDGTFASADAIESGRVRLIEGKRGATSSWKGRRTWSWRSSVPAPSARTG